MNRIRYILFLVILLTTTLQSACLANIQTQEGVKEDSATATSKPQPTIPPPVPATFYLGYNASIPPFDNAQVRQAFAMAIDKEEINSQLGSGHQTATSFTHPEIWPEGFQDFKEIGLPYNPVGAMGMLDQFIKNNNSMFSEKIVIAISNSGPHRLIAELITTNWKEHLGIDVEIISTEWSEYLDLLEIGEGFNAYLLGWKADYASPYNFLYDTFNSNSYNNYIHIRNTAYDDLLIDAWNEPDSQVQLQMYMEAEIMLCVDMAGIIPIYYYYTSDN